VQHLVLVFPIDPPELDFQPFFLPFPPENIQVMRNPKGPSKRLKLLVDFPSFLLQPGNGENVKYILIKSDKAYYPLKD